MAEQVIEKINEVGYRSMMRHTMPELPDPGEPELDALIKAESKKDPAKQKRTMETTQMMSTIIPGSWTRQRRRDQEAYKKAKAKRLAEKKASENPELVAQEKQEKRGEVVQALSTTWSNLDVSIPKDKAAFGDTFQKMTSTLGSTTGLGSTTLGFGATSFNTSMLNSSMLNSSMLNSSMLGATANTSQAPLAMETTLRSAAVADSGQAAPPAAPATAAGDKTAKTVTSIPAYVPSGPTLMGLPSLPQALPRGLAPRGPVQIVLFPHISTQEAHRREQEEDLSFMQDLPGAIRESPARSTMSHSNTSSLRAARAKPGVTSSVL